MTVDLITSYHELTKIGKKFPRLNAHGLKIQKGNVLDVFSKILGSWFCENY